MTRLAHFSITLLLVQSALADPLVLDPATHASTVAPFVKEHCVHCHGPDKQKGKFRIDTLPVDFSDSSAAEKWLEVVDNINLGEMPPDDEPPPEAKQLTTVAKWIADELRNAQRSAQSTGGRVLMRRLSRSEYANTVRDLLHVRFLPSEGPADLLSPDGSLDGFDKVSKALLLDPSLMEQYFDMASRIADKAIVTGPPPVPTRTNHMEYEHISGGIEYIKQHRSTIVTDDGIISMEHGMRSEENLRHPWNDQLIPIRGRYKVRLRVGADPGARGEPIYIRVHRQGDGDLWHGPVTGTMDEPQIIEIERAFAAEGGNEIGVENTQRHELRRQQSRPQPTER